MSRRRKKARTTWSGQPVDAAARWLAAHDPRAQRPPEQTERDLMRGWHSDNQSYLKQQARDRPRRPPKVGGLKTFPTAQRASGQESQRRAQHQAPCSSPASDATRAHAARLPLRLPLSRAAVRSETTCCARSARSSSAR